MINEYIRYIKTLFPAGSKIVVAMSGGVDSSVTAALLHRAGFEVIGVTMQLYRTPELVRAKGCCAGVDIQDARAVAEHEGFQHFVLDYANLFKERVIKNFIYSYEKGETPIPCGRCNQYMKFGALLDFTNKIGANYLATGHYSKRIETLNGPQLYKSDNKAKDQSYFLALMSYEQFLKVHFPLTDIDKNIVRKLAELMGLKVAQKSESQDICFVTSDSYTDFLYAVRPEMFLNGPIYSMDGKQLGTHNGIAHYTIGQRKGMNLVNGPWYVVDLDITRNAVVVGKIKDLQRSVFAVEEISYITNDISLLNKPLLIQIRARHEPVSGVFDIKKKQVTFYSPQTSITPGQICAFYSENNQLLAGAIIKKVFLKSND